jgi:excisionase family DNA binding protein
MSKRKNSYKLKEAAERLDVSVKTLYRIKKRGEIHVQRFGKRTYRITDAELERYIKNTRILRECKDGKNSGFTNQAENETETGGLAADCGICGGQP